LSAKGGRQPNVLGGSIITTPKKGTFQAKREKEEERKEKSSRIKEKKKRGELVLQGVMSLSIQDPVIEGNSLMKT